MWFFWTSVVRFPLWFPFRFVVGCLVCVCVYCEALSVFSLLRCIVKTLSRALKHTHAHSRSPREFWTLLASYSLSVWFFVQLDTNTANCCALRGSDQTFSRFDRIAAVRYIVVVKIAALRLIRVPFACIVFRVFVRPTASTTTTETNKQSKHKIFNRTTNKFQFGWICICNLNDKLCNRLISILRECTKIRTRHNFGWNCCRRTEKECFVRSSPMRSYHSIHMRCRR